MLTSIDVGIMWLNGTIARLWNEQMFQTCSIATILEHSTASREAANLRNAL